MQQDFSDASAVDIENIRYHKYLFVGHIDSAIKEIESEFPNSTFMNEETYNLKNVKADYIVFLIRFMSHSMFYKVINTGSLSDIPVIYCNTKSMKSILNEMQNQIQ